MEGEENSPGKEEKTWRDNALRLIERNLFPFIEISAFAHAIDEGVEQKDWKKVHFTIGSLWRVLKHVLYTPTERPRGVQSDFLSELTFYAPYALSLTLHAVKEMHADTSPMDTRQLTEEERKRIERKRIKKEREKENAITSALVLFALFAQYARQDAELEEELHQYLRNFQKKIGADREKTSGDKQSRNQNEKREMLILRAIVAMKKETAEDVSRVIQLCEHQNEDIARDAIYTISKILENANAQAEAPSISLPITKKQLEFFKTIAEKEHLKKHVVGALTKLANSDIPENQKRIVSYFLNTEILRVQEGQMLGSFRQDARSFSQKRQQPLPAANRENKEGRKNLR